MSAQNPMLAGKLKSVDQIIFPTFISPKYDGIRARIINGVVLSRSNKPIPNKHVQKLFGHAQFNGLDGELIVGSPVAEDVYRVTDSAVMTIEGEPNVKFYVFDDFVFPDEPFFARNIDAQSRVKKSKIFVPVPHIKCLDLKTFEEWEEKWLADGYEGMMGRLPDGPYKSGRATPKQNWLFKIKRFLDGEARILDFEEEMHNSNEAKTDELGAKSRSSKKAGMVGKNTLGAILVEDLKTKVKFKIGTGFSKKEREDLWMIRAQLRGKIVKYKFFPIGIKYKPRHPVYHGFRNKIDL